MFCQRPEYIAHKVGQSIQQLKGKYKFAWALLTERPFLCKLIQTLDVELIDYVCGQLGVEKVNPDSEERLIELGMTGLPLSDWSRSRCRQHGREQPSKDHWFCDSLVMVVFCAELDKGGSWAQQPLTEVWQLPEHTCRNATKSRSSMRCWQ